MALDEYEKGFTSARLDEVFSQVGTCTPLVVYCLVVNAPRGCLRSNQSIQYQVLAHCMHMHA